jgi:hypothetical protein
MGKFRRGRKAEWGYLVVTVYKMGKCISDRGQMGIF